MYQIELASFPDPWSHEMLSETLHTSGGKNRGAWAGDQLVGYCLIRIMAEDAELLNIAVASHARRGGVGHTLLEWAIAESAAQGATQMFLEVRAGNVAARALYERHGFLAVGRRRGYYTAPREDAIVYALALG